ncbi:MAG: ABC transporter ATP-binding protein [Nitriliruptoraceae bacterium]
MLQIDNARVRYGDFEAVRGVNLTVLHQQVMAIVGPSGCGKSTLLRAIAGLEPMADGAITLAKRRIDRLPPHRRRVGLMFQDNALFPHRTVADNVAFGLRMRGDTSGTIAGRVAEVLRLVDLDGAQSRSVAALSGGEQQRVALARAIAPQPDVLMLDEPLGSLDRPLQRRLLADLPDLLRSVGTATIYVTHDQDEALHLADQVAVMNKGQLVQVATPRNIVQQPADAFVARFLGYETLLPARIADGFAITSLGRTPLPDGWAPHIPQNKPHAWVVVRPDAIRMASDQPAEPPLATVTAHVEASRWLTDRCEVTFTLDDDSATTPDRLDARVTGEQVVGRTRLRMPWWHGDPPDDGATMQLTIDLSALHVVAG